MNKEDAAEDLTGKRKKTFREKIYLQPIAIGTAFPYCIVNIVHWNLALERACLVDLGYSRDECFSKNKTIKSLTEMESQKIVAVLTGHCQMITSVIVCSMLLFVGTWSDKTGRRKPLFLMFFSGLLAVSLIMILVQFIPSANATWIVYLQQIPSAFGGQIVIFFMAIYSHIGDLCYKANKSPTKMVALYSVWSTGTMILGNVLTPIIFRNLGYLGCYSINAIIQILVILYIAFFIKDVFKKNDKVNIIDFSLPITAFRCLVKKREEKKRKNLIILILLIPLFANFVWAAEGVVLYLYLRFKFQWTEVEYGLYMTLKGISSFLGTVIIVKLLKGRFKLEDKSIAIISTMFDLFGSAVLILSTEGWMIYITPFIGLFSRGTVFMQKPLINRNILASEQGQLLSLCSIWDKGTTALLVTLVSYVYMLTIEISPSLFLFFSIIGSISMVISYSSIKTYPFIENQDEIVNKDDN